MPYFFRHFSRFFLFILPLCVVLVFAAPAARAQLYLCDGYKFTSDPSKGTNCRLHQSYADAVLDDDAEECEDDSPRFLCPTVNDAVQEDDVEECKRLVLDEQYGSALSYCKRAAEQGDEIAQSHTGWMYDNGQGVLQDKREAVRWYQLAAAQGSAWAQNSTGNMYYYGQGVGQDYIEAVKWYRLAAEQGYVDAQKKLSRMYYHGAGVQRDVREAAKWYRLLAEQGDDNAQYTLGYMYDNGVGVLQDKREAYIWYSLAAVNGAGSAVKNRDVVEKDLSADQLRAAKKEVKKRLAAIDARKGG